MTRATTAPRLLINPEEEEEEEEDTDDESAIQSKMVWLGRCHLAFAVANGVLNRRFSAATVGCCGDGWKLRRVDGEACNKTGNALSI